jgi:hypothetical protein
MEHVVWMCQILGNVYCWEVDIIFQNTPHLCTCHGYIGACEQVELFVCYRYTIMVGSTKYCSFLFIVSSSIQSLGFWYWGQKSKSMFLTLCVWQVSKWLILFRCWCFNYTPLSGLVIYTYPLTADMFMKASICLTLIMCYVILKMFIWLKLFAVDSWTVLSC